MRKLKGYEEEEKYGCYDFGMMRSMVKIAVPSTLQQSIVHMGILLVQSVVNSFGSAALAGYSAGSRIESLSIVPMLAMGNAMSTFTAQNIGAGKLDRVKEGYKMCYVTVLTVGAGLCIMYQLFGGAFVSMFLESGGSTAYSVGVSYVKFLSFFYAFIGLRHYRWSSPGSWGCGGIYGGQSGEFVHPGHRHQRVCPCLRDPGGMDGRSHGLGGQLYHFLWLVSDGKMEAGEGNICRPGRKA